LALPGSVDPWLGPAAIGEVFSLAARAAPAAATAAAASVAESAPAGAQRIDAALAAAEQLIWTGREQAFLGFGLVMAAGVIAATEPIAHG